MVRTAECERISLLFLTLWQMDSSIKLILKFLPGDFSSQDSLSVSSCLVRLRTS